MDKADFKNIHSKNNFDLLRLLAALFVLISHSFSILQKTLQQPALWYNDKSITLGDIGLYIFFTISGFLVTQSLFDSDSLKHYFFKRLLRIMPALIIANLFCIFLGCFITDLHLKDYLFNTNTWAYLLKNSTFVVNQLYLPGVFNNLKDNTINASLWTLPLQVTCYLVLLFGAYVIVIRKWLFLSCFVLFEALKIYMTISANFHIKGFDVQAGFTLGTYFFLGSLLYRFKDDIRFKWFYANILMAVALATVYTSFEAITLSVFFAYCFIIIGTSKAVISLRGHNLSYGIYLYAFPMQQLLVKFFGYSINVWLHIAMSAVLALLLALLSWTFIEKPFLTRKTLF